MMPTPGGPSTYMPGLVEKGAEAVSKITQGAGVPFVVNKGADVALTAPTGLSGVAIAGIVVGVVVVVAALACLVCWLCGVFD